MTNSNRVSVIQAAKEVGVAPQGLKEMMKRGIIDIGVVVPSVKGNQKQYWIFRDKLDYFLGKNLKETQSNDADNARAVTQ